MRYLDKRIKTGMAMLLLAVGTASAETITAIASGNVTNSATWPVGTTLPEAGNTDIWQSANRNLDVSAGTYNGGTLVVQAGGTLRTAGAGSTATMQNIVLDGGRIFNVQALASTYNFTTLTLNSGSIRAGDSGGARTVYLNSGALAGSGTITISSGTTVTNLVSFNTAGGSVTTTNFTGWFGVDSTGLLEFTGGTTAGTFGITVATGGLLALANGADTKVTQLSLGGSNYVAGTYSAMDLGTGWFTTTNGTVTVTIGTGGGGEPEIITAIAAGTITTAAPWPVGTTLPSPGNIDIWQSGSNTLSNAGTFYGGTLVIQPGGSYRTGATDATATAQNVVLDGGRIVQNSAGYARFNCNTLTLNSGTILAGGSGTGAKRPIFFDSGALQGNGAITINCIAIGGNAVTFDTAGGLVATTNFTGSFNVDSLGILAFSGGTTAGTFGISAVSGGRLVLADGTDTKVTSLTLGGSSFVNGTYDAGDLGAYAFSPTSTGTITVIPEPATLGLITAVGAGLIGIRRLFMV